VSDNPVIKFPKSEEEEERARRLRVEVERLARQSSTEWMYHVESSGYAEKYGITKPALREMIEAVIKENEKKQREDKGELRRREKQEITAKKETDRAEERRQHAEQRRQERIDREDRKEAERKEREKQKAFESIIKLPTIEHDAKLKTLARQLDENIEVLREEFDELRSEEQERIRSGEAEPWGEPVNTRKLLDAMEAQFRRYVIIHDQTIAPMIPLWMCFAWVHDIAAFSPILIFESADAGEGKTAASKLISLLTPRAFIIVEPTGPAFYRFVDRVHPTLIIDDADRLLPRRPDLAHIINSGWTRGIPIPRTDAKTGDVHLFDPFCPKVLNGINLLAHLAPATRTRCITIKMLPKLESEKVADHRHANRDENFVTLRRKLLRWSLDNIAAIDNAKPEMPKGFFSRLEENYHLMFAIADLAGGDWPKRARAAAVKLSREHNEPSMGKRLLSILFDLTVKHRTTLFTSAQLPQLVSEEDDTFASYQHGRPINKYEIAVLLKPYCGIHPKTIHPRAARPATAATTRLGRSSNAHTGIISERS
jgi:putative DNA primase/helicase